MGTDGVTKRATPDERQARLLARRDEIDRRLKALTKRQSTESRRADTRRKILVGAAVLAEAAELPNSQLRVWLAAALRRRLTPRDLTAPGIADLLSPSPPTSQPQTQSQGGQGNERL